MTNAPEIGDITTRTKLGLAGRSKMIYAQCPQCGDARWTMLAGWRKKKGAVLCLRCSGRKSAKKLREWRGDGDHRNDCKCFSCSPPDQWADKNPSWNGGVTEISGYVAVLLSPDDPFVEMSDVNRYVLEHRLVVARKLGRPLKKGETVHHKNGNKTDNRIENLELWFTNHSHGVRVEDVLADWARLYNYHCPGCKREEHENE